MKRTITILVLTTLACGDPLLAVPAHVGLLREAAAAGKAGDPATALARLEAAAKLRPDYPRIQLNLARGYAAAGRPDDALAALQRLADMGLLLNVATDPALATLQDLPRFKELAARISAPEPTTVGELSAMHLTGVTGIIESALFAPASGIWLCGDVRNRCIWERDAGGALKKFTDEADHLDGVFKVALSPDRKTLWAATGGVGAMAGADVTEGGRSALATIDVSSGRVLARYPTPADGRKHLLGDFIFASDGAVYATDSFAPVIWRLPPQGAHLEAWLESDEFLNLQGLAFSADDRTLFVADYSNGIWRIPADTKQPSLLVAPANATFFGIDGLYASGDSLLAVQNGVNPQRILRIAPAPDARPSTAKVVAAGYPAMTDLSLGFVAENRFWFVADSGWALFDPPPEKTPRPRTVTVYSFALDN